MRIMLENPPGGGPGGGRKPDPTLVAFGIDELRVSLEESVRFPKKARSLVYLEGR